MNWLEGANCADLPGFVIDKYFDCHYSNEPLKAMVAMAICANCPVSTECREIALNSHRPQPRGVIGGVPASHIKHARAWRSYEQGITDQVPTHPRPEWLARSDATEIVEQARVEADPDETDN